MWRPGLVICIRTIIFLGCGWGLQSRALSGKLSHSCLGISGYDGPRDLEVPLRRAVPTIVREIAARIGLPEPDRILLQDPFDLVVTETVARDYEGQTSFSFKRSSVDCEKLEIRAPSSDRALRVLRHELTHYVLAHHFGRPVPRWFDEGYASLQEGASARRISLDGACGAQYFGLNAILEAREYDAYPTESTDDFYFHATLLTEFLLSRFGLSQEEPPERAAIEFVRKGTDRGWRVAIAQLTPPVEKIGFDREYLRYLNEQCRRIGRRRELIH